MPFSVNFWMLAEALRLSAGNWSAGQLATGNRPAPSRSYGPSPDGANGAPIAAQGGVPSTTAGTSLGANTAGRAPRWVAIAAAVAGLTLVTALILLTVRHGKGAVPSDARASASAASAAAIPHTEAAAAALRPPSAPVSPSTPTSLVPRPPASASAEEKPATALGHFVARPPPPSTPAKPAPAPTPTSKPRGGIDLGY